LDARLAVNVRRLREAKGWTQEECASQCGRLDPAVLRVIEAANANVTATTVARLCDGLGVDVLDLFAQAGPLVKRKRGRPPKKDEAPVEEPDAVTTPAEPKHSDHAG
jgi:transcriptional regulator with XRE-family HTH domain